MHSKEFQKSVIKEFLVIKVGFRALEMCHNSKLTGSESVTLSTLSTKLKNLLDTIVYEFLFIKISFSQFQNTDGIGISVITTDQLLMIRFQEYITRMILVISIYSLATNTSLV